MADGSRVKTNLGMRMRNDICHCLVPVFGKMQWNVQRQTEREDAEEQGAGAAPEHRRDGWSRCLP